MGARRVRPSVLSTVLVAGDEAERSAPSPLHAHEVTPADASLMRMMVGANFGPDARVTLPSGKTITGAEMARWVATEDAS